MTVESFQRGVNKVKQDKVDRQYREVADEVQNLKAIVCKVAEYQNQSEEMEERKRQEEQKMQKQYENKNLGYREEKLEKQSPWWWPFYLSVDESDLLPATPTVKAASIEGTLF